MTIHDASFRAARPVWEKGLSRQMNRTVSFCANIAAGEPAGDRVTLYAASSGAFILLVNGRFVAHGPARGPRGFFRVDRYDLTPLLTRPVNRVALRVVGYRVPSYAYQDQPPFLCAEITAGDRVLRATGAAGTAGFTAYAVRERLSRVQRYSLQRPFAETYRLKKGAFGYETDPDASCPPVETEPAEAGRFLARDVPEAEPEDVRPVGVIARGTAVRVERDGPSSGESHLDSLPGYRRDELEYASHTEAARIAYADRREVSESAETIVLSAGSYADVAFPCNAAGILDFDLETEGEGTLFILFDEVQRDGEVTLFRLGISNVAAFLFERGAFRMTCAEPHVMRYARLCAMGAVATVRRLTLRHIAFPASLIRTRFAGSDETMRRIYDAAVETFRANSVDLFMDCPSRERAGWLCDSFFTARVERVLTGRSDLERAFLQNFLLPDRFEALPEGMLPMCYPSDHLNGVFIPNWAMWYGLELREYFERTRDRELIDEARDRMYALLRYFQRFENEEGLLEGLESWVFVEWSKANELTQDVSFPSNMLYACLLRDMGALYGDDLLTEKSAATLAAVNRLSLTPSGFYCDNAVRRDGALVPSGERTEACQYYAFFSGAATPEANPRLWETLVSDFGFDRAERGLYPEIYPANAFIGNYLRLELLDRFGCREKLYGDIKGYFSYMADRTGTLWENTGDYASCNHGFASHVLYWMDRLGLLSRDKGEP